VDDRDVTPGGSGPVPGGGGARLACSWRRSALYRVDPEMGTLFLDDPVSVNPDIQIRRTGSPILASFQEVFRDTRGLVFLTDARGRLCGEWAPERSSRALFDTVGAREGADAAEAKVGTNAAGTALEDDRPILLRGEEHYQRTFDRFACAGAVVHHPVTRRALGAVGFASPVGEVKRDRMLLAFAIRAAQQIEQALLDQATTADVLVLQELKVRARGNDRMVVGVSQDMLIANEPGVRVLHLIDEGILLESAREAITSAREATVELTLDADPVTVRCTPVLNGARAVGAVLEFGGVRPMRSMPRPAVTSTTKPVVAEEGRLVGRSRVTCALRDQISALAVSGDTPVLCGEAGSGKTHVALLLLDHRVPGVTPRIVECASPESVEEFVAGSVLAAPVVLAHLDQLDTTAAYRLRDAVRRLSITPGWIVATADAGTSWPASRVLDFLGARVEVPALRSRREDIGPLATHFLSSVAGPGRRIRGDALQILLRYSWPGNVRELRAVMVDAMRRTRREIVPDDLPQDLRRQATRRPLGPLEQAEADAILAALRVCRNNKVQAAALLQISRSRLYRKVKEYGLVGAALL